MRHHVYFSPGMFGFGKLGSYNYFAHVERELIARFAAAGVSLIAHVIDDLPTASIRRRATRLAEIVAQTSGNEPVHLLGHSTGGVDARLVASPATRSIPPATLAWLPNLRSVTTMNTPHYGTPLASFFTTASGQRLLAALSVLTVAGLAIGAQPLAAASLVLGIVRGTDKLLPFKIAVIDRSMASVAGAVDDVRAPEVRTFFTAIEDDQGSLLQLSPESMDLVVAGFEDRAGVVYQSTASMAPPPRAGRWLTSLAHPWQVASMAAFMLLQRVTASISERYPCAAVRDAAPWAGDANEAVLAERLAVAPALGANDGVVPLRSQIWGTLTWVGLADHLDVLGHFRDERGRDEIDPALRHRDWMPSGSEFGSAEFATLMDAIAAGMLTAPSAG